MLKRRNGLGSLIPGAELNTGAGPEFVPIVAIAVNPYQPRRAFAPEALEELAESIRQHGILQPLTVRPRDGGYQLIAGERRLQAARKAGLAEVPVMVRDCTDAEMLELALVENLQREDLNPMEAAQSYQQLMDEFGFSQTEVAARVGKSRPTVANTLRLLGLPAPIQAAVAAGSISEGHARALLAAPDPARQQTIFQETVARGLSVRAVEALVTPRTPDAPARRKMAKPDLDPNLIQVQDDFQGTLGVKVRFRPGSTCDKGVIEIEYYTADDLDRIFEAIHPVTRP
jgi:ParB family chromosome partitioning protein